MTRLPLIGLTAANNPTPDWGSGHGPQLDHDGQGRLYSEAIAKAGGLPFILPLVRTPLDESDEWMSACGPGSLFDNAVVYMDHLDGLILSGGGDLAQPPGADDPDLYRLVDKSRDIWETALLSAALKMDKPVLAICRGIQLINSALGGTLYADLETERPGPVNHQQTWPRARATHQVTIEPGSRLAGVVGFERIMVNSGHHQGLKDLAPPLAAAAWADDSLIEAVEHREAGFVIGVQWHPEGHLAVNHSQAIFKAFIQAAGGGL